MDTKALCWNGRKCNSQQFISTIFHQVAVAVVIICVTTAVILPITTTNAESPPRYIRDPPPKEQQCDRGYFYNGTSEACEPRDCIWEALQNKCNSSWPFSVCKDTPITDGPDTWYGGSFFDCVTTPKHEAWKKAQYQDSTSEWELLKDVAKAIGNILNEDCEPGYYYNGTSNECEPRDCVWEASQNICNTSWPMSVCKDTSIADGPDDWFGGSFFDCLTTPEHEAWKEEKTKSMADERISKRTALKFRDVQPQSPLLSPEFSEMKEDWDCGKGFYLNETTDGCEPKDCLWESKHDICMMGWPFSVCKDTPIKDGPDDWFGGSFFDCITTEKHEQWKTEIEKEVLHSQRDTMIALGGSIKCETGYFLNGTNGECEPRDCIWEEANRICKDGWPHSVCKNTPIEDGPDEWFGGSFFDCVTTPEHEAWKKKQAMGSESEETTGDQSEEDENGDGSIGDDDEDENGSFADNDEDEDGSFNDDDEDGSFGDGDDEDEDGSYSDDEDEDGSFNDDDEDEDGSYGDDEDEDGSFNDDDEDEDGSNSDDEDEDGSYGDDDEDEDGSYGDDEDEDGSYGDDDEDRDDFFEDEDDGDDFFGDDDNNEDRDDFFGDDEDGDFDNEGSNEDESESDELDFDFGF